MFYISFSLLKLNLGNRRHAFFSSLVAKTEEQVKDANNKIRLRLVACVLDVRYAVTLKGITSALSVH